MKKPAIRRAFSFSRSRLRRPIRCRGGHPLPDGRGDDLQQEAEPLPPTRLNGRANNAER
ncbi:hypothetical protein CLJ1_0388 [Pseudomonas paraeruginosa]|nr:hypothetical protein CLJ1_0388 [Pseudomonas aeruginosa]